MQKCWRWSSNVCMLISSDFIASRVNLWGKALVLLYSCQMSQSGSGCIVSRNKKCFVPLSVGEKITFLINWPDTSHHLLHCAALYSSSSPTKFTSEKGDALVRDFNFYLRLASTTPLFVQAWRSNFHCRYPLAAPFLTGCVQRIWSQTPLTLEVNGPLLLQCDCYFNVIWG